jgi:hypothetical protein
MAIDYRVSRVGKEHDGLLPPVVLAIDDGLAGGFSFTDYLTVEQAFKIAADLTAQAMKAEREDEPAIGDPIPYDR